MFVPKITRNIPGWLAMMNIIIMIITAGFPFGDQVKITTTL
jgi:hypothetical protein